MVYRFTPTGWTPNYGDFTGSLGIFITEITWLRIVRSGCSHGPAPSNDTQELRMVMTEQGDLGSRHAGADGSAYTMPMFRHLRRQSVVAIAVHRASVRQCISRPGRPSAIRHRRGQLMWDPTTRTSRHVAAHRSQAEGGFADYPRDEAITVVGETAIQVFGFDRTVLTDLASSIGPPADLLGCAR
jgi:hypothetical protein